MLTGSGQEEEVSAAPRLNTEEPVGSVVSRLQAMIPAQMKQHAVPGLSIALIRNARIVWSQGFGVRDTTSQQPVTAETVFEAGSLSKPTFGYYVLKLCETGVLGLDTPLETYRNEPFISNEPRLRQITPRRVLSHTSGLPHGRARGTPLKLQWDPGKEFHYSSIGFHYLQDVIESLINQRIGEYMRRSVLEPFQMRSSSFEWQERYSELAAQGYDAGGKPGQTLNEQYRHLSPDQKAEFTRPFPEMKIPSGAGGMYTTASDFARLLIEIIQPTKRDRFHLSASMRAEMFKPHVRVIDGVHWGLGWGREMTPAGDAFWHWGNWGIFQNFAIAYPREKIGVVILTNSGNGLKACKAVVPVAVGGEHPAFTMIDTA